MIESCVACASVWIAVKSTPNQERSKDPKMEKNPIQTGEHRHGRLEVVCCMGGVVETAHLSLAVHRRRDRHATSAATKYRRTSAVSQCPTLGLQVQQSAVQPL